MKVMTTKKKTKVLLPVTKIKESNEKEEKPSLKCGWGVNCYKMCKL